MNEIEHFWHGKISASFVPSLMSGIARFTFANYHQYIRMYVCIYIYHVYNVQCISIYVMWILFCNIMFMKSRLDMLIFVLGFEFQTVQTSKFLSH